MNEETTEKITHEAENAILKAIADISRRLDAQDLQLEVIREGIVQNSARFDQLEAIALEAKSIALVTRSQLTILTEEMRQRNKQILV